MSIKSDKWIKRQCEKTRDACYHDGVFLGYKDSYPVSMILNGLTSVDPRGVSIVSKAVAPMIEPFEPKQIRQKEHRLTADQGHTERVISYGVSSYGYDVRCGNKFKVFTNINSTVVDPKNFDEKNFVEVDADEHDGVCIIPPNSFALANTVEFFRIPRNVLTICLGKSTYARCGIIVNVTPLEPEFEGSVTLEFSNTTPLPAKIYAGEGVAQMLFFESDEECEVSYKDRGGKYMGQGHEPVTPRV